MEKRLSIKAYIILAVAGHQEPNYCNVATWRERTQDGEFFSAIRDLLGQAASGATFPGLTCWRARQPSHLLQVSETETPENKAIHPFPGKQVFGIPKVAEVYVLIKKLELRSSCQTDNCLAQNQAFSPLLPWLKKSENHRKMNCLWKEE